MRNTCVQLYSLTIRMHRCSNFYFSVTKRGLHLCASLSIHLCPDTSAGRSPKSVTWETGMSLCVSITFEGSYQSVPLHFEWEGWLIHSAHFIPFIIFFFSPFDEQAVSVIHLLSSSPKSLSICPPSFRLSPCPIHSHTFSVWPLATPAAKAMTDTSVKKKKGERWKEAGLQMHIHPVPMQSSATPSWCFKTRLSWGRQAGNRFKARRKERDKWGKNKKFRFKLAEQPKGSSRTKN